MRTTGIIMNSHFVDTCTRGVLMMMSGTSAFPIVLDTDSELEDTEEEAQELLTTLKPKESSLKLICTKRHR